MASLQHISDLLAHERQVRKRRRNVLVALGCTVALASAIALMVPAMSLTEDAVDEAGAILEEVQAPAEDEALDELAGAEAEAEAEAGAEAEAEAAPAPEPEPAAPEVPADADSELAPADLAPAELPLQATPNMLAATPLLAATSAGTTYTVEAGQTVTIKGTSNKKSHTWSSSDAAVATVSGNSNEATVVGVSAGTATITHVYNDSKSKETFTVTVTAAETVTDSNASAKQYDGLGMTVSVKANGNAKKLSDYKVVVADASADYSGDDIKAAYHIYLAAVDDPTNKEVDVTTGNNGKLKMDVAIAYSNGAPWADPSKVTVDHYKNGSKEDVTLTSCTANSITFTVNSFSEFVLSETAQTTGDGTSVSAQSSSIMEGRTINDDNQWQIVSQQYSGNAATNKTLSADGNVRIQKNVIPTGVENEFYVYLSVDTKSEVTTKQFSDYVSDKSHYVVGSSSHFPNNVIKGQLGQLQGSEKGGAINDSKSNKNKTYNVTLKYKGVTLGTAYFVADISNSCLYFKLRSTANHNDEAYIALYEFKSESDIEVELSREAYERLAEEVTEYSEKTTTTITSVTDQLGDYVTFLGLEKGDYSTSTATPTVGSNGGAINWVPTAKAKPTLVSESTAGSTSTWYNNTAELLYKVRLDVTKLGFNSCASNMKSKTSDPESYAVNQSATLAYAVKTGSAAAVPKTATFQQPYVRGLLYDLPVKKVDQDGAALAGAQFTLTGAGNSLAPTKSGTSVASGMVERDGSSAFAGMPWGAYTLEETAAPSGYRRDTSTYTVDLCYTTNKANLSASSIDDTHMALSGSDWRPKTIQNQKNVVTVTKAVAVRGDLPMETVDHTVYIALREQETEQYLTDAAGNIVYRTITITDGVPSPSTVTFDEGIETGAYDVMELAAVDGASATKLSTGDVLISGTELFQVAGISASCSYAGENGSMVTESKNNANLMYSNTAQVDFTNTYSRVSTIDFVAKKEWQSATGQALDAPAGATVTFSLYRRVGDGAIEAVAGKVIELDGNPDDAGEASAWTATFKNLPAADTGGSQYTYLVRETACSDADFEAWKGNAAMGQGDYLENNGGTIYNRQKTTSFTVRKVDERGEFLAGASFALYRMVPSGEGEDARMIDTAVGEPFTVSSQDGFAVSGLVSGRYKLVETSAPAGYLILGGGVELTVNATGEGSVLGWPDGGSAPAGASLSADGTTVTIANTPGQSLPNTGGEGYELYTFGGGMVLLAVALLAVRKLRRGWSL